MLLRNFFLLAIKSVEDNQLPMPVNVFYANHVLAQKYVRFCLNEWAVHKCMAALLGTQLFFHFSY